MITHRPKGSMCIGCDKFHCVDKMISECPTHDELTKMRVIGKDYDGIIVVKCDKYEKNNG